MVTANHYELLVIIIDDLDRLPALLDALREAGVSGATLLTSIGAYRAKNWLDEIGLAGLHKMFGAAELKRRTLLAVIRAEHVDGAIAAAEQAMGGFGRENSGILFTVPVRRAVGVQKRERRERSETIPATDLTDIMIRDTPLDQVVHILNIEPVVMPTSATLLEAAKAFLQSPYAHVGAIISQTGHLLGVITLRQLADHIFFGIMPEVFYSELTSDIDQSLDFGKMANVHNIADLMLEPVSIRLSDTVGDAFAQMHKHGLSGLPIVDENTRVVGYISLQDLLNLSLDILKGRKSS